MNFLYKVEYSVHRLTRWLFSLLYFSGLLKIKFTIVGQFRIQNRNTQQIPNTRLVSPITQQWPKIEAEYGGGVLVEKLKERTSKIMLQRRKRQEVKAQTLFTHRKKLVSVFKMAYSKRENYSRVQGFGFNLLQTLM